MNNLNLFLLQGENMIPGSKGAIRGIIHKGKYKIKEVTD